MLAASLDYSYTQTMEVMGSSETSLNYQIAWLHVLGFNIFRRHCRENFKPSVGT
jgi:hypothetical protein